MILSPSRTVRICGVDGQPGKEFIRVAGEATTTLTLKAFAFEAGDAVVFPAKKVWHRVTKTRSGLRRTVVFWVRSASGGGGGDGGAGGGFDPGSDSD